MLAGFRNFLLTFIISLIIFGVIAFFVVNMVLDSVGVGGVMVNDVKAEVSASYGPEAFADGLIIKKGKKVFHKVTM